MHATAHSPTDSRVRTVLRAVTLDEVHTQSSSPATAVASPDATAPPEAVVDIDDGGERVPQLWYAVFLSTFLIGLLMLGGFWIWFNVRFL